MSFSSSSLAHEKKRRKKKVKKTLFFFSPCQSSTSCFTDSESRGRYDGGYRTEWRWSHRSRLLRAGVGTTRATSGMVTVEVISSPSSPFSEGEEEEEIGPFLLLLLFLRSPSPTMALGDATVTSISPRTTPSKALAAGESATWTYTARNPDHG